jgi:hypothetical protein
MAIDENRRAVAAWACAATLVARGANAAQRTTTLPDPAGTTLDWGTADTSSSKAPAQPPTLLPAEEAKIVEEEPGAARAYGTRGVFELGGFVNFSGGAGFTSIQLSPTAGLFLLDGVELSAIFGVSYVRRTLDSGAGAERFSRETIVRFLGEPSYHVSFSPTVLGFLGVGLGVASVPHLSGGASAALDVASRAGVNVLVGRSGLLTSAAFVDHTNGTSTYGIQAGYTVVW